MAEGLARSLLPGGFEVKSAGSNPSTVNPLAVEALSEIGIDISQSRSKSIGDLPADFVDELDCVVTLCAEEVCPVILSEAKKLHWPFPDPASAQGTHSEKLASFRQVRDGIRAAIVEFRNSNRT